MAPAEPGNVQRGGRRSAAADDHAGWGVALSGERGGLAGVQGEAEARQRDGSGDRSLVGDEGHVYGPVGAGHLAVFTSAVERFDDPDAVGVETGEVILAFLAEHGVVGALLGEPTHQQLVSLTVALGLEHRLRRVLGAGIIAVFLEHYRHRQTRLWLRVLRWIAKAQTKHRIYIFRQA